MRNKSLLHSERREYIRLDSVFPVQYRLVSMDGKHYFSSWLQGFTNNIGKGGICLQVNNLEPGLLDVLKKQAAKVSLQIEIPFSRNPVCALTKIVWVKDAAGAYNKYIVGLNYEMIDPVYNRRLMHYIRMKKIFVPFLLAIIFLLGAALAVNSVVSMKLAKKNKALIGQFINIMQQVETEKQRIAEMSKEREGLEAKIAEFQQRIEMAEKQRQEAELKAEEQGADAAKKIGESNGLIEALTKDRDSLEQQLLEMLNKENAAKSALEDLDKRKEILEKENFQKLYTWLKVHQNPRTGLVMSFEGDKDIADWAATYDQSLALQAFCYFNDFARAKSILDFFSKRAKKTEGRFYNVYYVKDGAPAEYIVHTGPNIWLGIAVLQYTNRSADTSYLSLAENIADRAIQLQGQDPDGGIRGGPDVSWYATEHNLDAYAFFDMLNKLTSNKRYLQAKDKVLNWLIQHTYDSVDVPIKRGKGDSSIATDTYAWSIAAIGPEKLEELGMDPDKIMEFAEDNCAVGVSFQRPDGKVVKIQGFDFAAQRHVARGGVVSSEWTAQMVISFKIMSEYYLKKDMPDKAKAYALKADNYLRSLSSMIISSPSASGQGEGCLPYASEDFVDTGHGWMTPKGSCTGSVAGTAYTLFAYYGYNPLNLNPEDKIQSKSR